MAASTLFLLPCHADEAAGYRSKKKKKNSSSFFFPTPEVRDLARTVQGGVGGGGGEAPDSSVPADRSNEAVLEAAAHHSTTFSFRLCKLPISGSISPTIRNMVEEVKMGLLGGQAPKIASEGSGGVYFMKDRCGLTNVAVFKPMDEEPMAPNNPRGFSASSHGEGLRKGSRSGEGALREVAAFLLDHPPSLSESESPGGTISKTRSKLEIEGFSGVPPTTMIECYHSSFHYASDSWPLMRTKKAKKGSLQLFVHALSSCEDMGYSRFPVEEVHKISILDVRLANTDRNAGNILVSRREDGELKLVPIDHGYCLPTKVSFKWLHNVSRACC
jgi:hypothetical protein